MKCEIIKDLLPSYVDSLTSDESNFEIEEHLKNCSDCAQVYEQMKADIKTKPVVYNKEKIKPFKKLNKKIIHIVIAVIVICVLASNAYTHLFVKGWKINSKDMNFEYSYQNGQLIFNFELKNGRILNAWGMTDNDGTEIGLKQCFYGVLNIQNIPNPNQFIYDIDCMDEKGNIKQFTEDDLINLVFSDKTETYSLKDMAIELGIK